VTADELVNSQELIPRLQRILSSRSVDGTKPAGVLVPLYHVNECWHVVLTLRSNQVRQHKNEVAFPGGVLDPEDADMVSCALRESWEEMGILPKHVNIIGTLDTMLTRTNYLVWPVVGVVSSPYKFVINPREVAEVFEIPIPFLLKEDSIRHESRMLADGTILRRHSYTFGEFIVFGATAWILDQLLEMIRTALKA
jgi:8-oxo-dGTP pyrophosphatase MutT (NUDIX family)